jgi:hypothetical protein
MLDMDFKFVKHSCAPFHHIFYLLEGAWAQICWFIIQTEYFNENIAICKETATYMENRLSDSNSPDFSGFFDI